MKRLMGGGGEGSKRLGKSPTLAEPELWPVRMGKSRRRQQYPRRGRMEAMRRCFLGVGRSWPLEAGGKEVVQGGDFPVLVRFSAVCGVDGCGRCRDGRMQQER